MQAKVRRGWAPTIGNSAHEGGDADNGQSKSETLVGNVREDDGNKLVDDVEGLAEEAADEARYSEDSEEPEEVREEVNAQEPADEAADKAADDKDDVEYFLTDGRDDSNDERN